MVSFCPSPQCVLSEERFPWCWPGSVELCPCYGKCATHVGAVQQKEVRRRSRERANGIERASEIWWKGASATVRIIVGEKLTLTSKKQSPPWSFVFVRAGCVMPAGSFSHFLFFLCVKIQAKVPSANVLWKSITKCYLSNVFFFVCCKFIYKWIKLTHCLKALLLPFVW